MRERKWYIILDICAYINNILYNIIFFPIYLIMLLVFWPKELLAWEWFTYNWEGKKTSLFESLRSSPLACDCHIKNTRHNMYSLLIFNFILLFINLFLGYYTLLFIFVVNSPLRMCRFNDQSATIIRSNYILYIDIRKRELHVQQATFTNLITGKKMSKPWHFLGTVEPTDYSLILQVNNIYNNVDKSSTRIDDTREITDKPYYEEIQRNFRKDIRFIANKLDKED